MIFNLTEQKVFKQLFKIQWSSYWKDILNLFSGTILLILTLSLWMIIRNNSGLLYDDYILASCIGVGTIRTGMNSFSRSIVSVNNIVKIRTISNFKQRIQVYLALISFNHSINLINVLIIVTYSTVFKHELSPFANVNWWMVIYAYFLLLITSNLYALFLHLIIKNNELVEAILELNYFTGVYLLGLVIPFSLMAGNRATLIASYFIFYRYAVNIICGGWMNAPNFVIPNQDGTFTDLGYGENIWIPYVVSGGIVLLLSITIITIISYSRMKNNKFQLRNAIRDRTTYLKEKLDKIEDKNKLQAYLKNSGENFDEK